MQCLHVSGSMLNCLLKSGVRFWEVLATMQFLHAVGTLTVYLLRRGVTSRKVRDKIS